MYILIFMSDIIFVIVYVVVVDKWYDKSMPFYFIYSKYGAICLSSMSEFIWENRTFSIVLTKYEIILYV